MCFFKCKLLIGSFLDGFCAIWVGFSVCSNEKKRNTPSVNLIKFFLDNGGGGNTSFGGGAGFPAFRTLVGEDVSTLAPTNAGDTWQVDSISFFTLAFGNGVSSTTFSNVTVECLRRGSRDHLGS